MNIEIDTTETFVTHSKLAQSLERNLRSRMVSMCAVENSYRIYGLSNNGKTVNCSLRDHIPCKFTGA